MQSGMAWQQIGGINFHYYSTERIDIVATRERYGSEMHALHHYAYMQL